MLDIVTIPEALRAAAGGSGLIGFHLEDGFDSLSATELLDRSPRHASVLVDQGVHSGDMVGLIGSNRPEWVEWAHAIWLVGATLVPLPAPVRVRDGEAFGDQIRALANAMNCRLVVSEPRYRGALGSLRTIDWHETSSDALEDQPPPSLDSIAVVLCTSGSTSLPKGALVDHRSIATREVKRAQNATMAGIEMFWVPFFHTGGVMSLLTPIYQGNVLHTLPAERFARDPLSWFRAVTDVGATGTGAASSSWLTTLRAAERKPDGIDLSTVRAARFSLELIDPDVIDLCVSVGARFGLDPSALSAAYGMSEGTGISNTPMGAGISIDSVDLEALVSERKARPATEGIVKRVVSCGKLTPGVELRIVDMEGKVLGEREIGEIIFRAPMMMLGYLGQQDSGLDSEGWFATGDLGYLVDDELYITGRIKEIIISRGHKYHPEDIERAAATSVSVTQDRCVAFPRPDVEGEVVIVVEAVEGVDPTTAPGMIRQAVASRVGGLVIDVVVVVPDSIPKTPAGKMKRREASDMLKAGVFEMAR